MRIGIVAHNALGAMRGGLGRHIGGVERQVSLLAKWLANRGHDVSVLAWDEGQGREIFVDGVRVLAMCRRDAGVPFFRFFRPRWSSLLSALARADCEIYYQNGAEYVTGQVAMWCRWRGRAMVFSSASDVDCHRRPEHLTSHRERLLYRYGIRIADQIVVQTEHQRRDLLTHYGRESAILPMGAPDPVGEGGLYDALRRSGAKFRVCWVGRISPEKRVEWVLDIASRMPDVPFDIVGGADGDPAYANALESRAAAMSNVVWHGRMPPDQVQSVYRKSDVLCCTSLFEGFPNTFLEAWAQGVAVISTVDPDDRLQNCRVGFKASNVEDFVATLAMLKGQTDERNALRARCRAYFLAEFAADQAFARFERLFEEAVIRKASPN